MDQHMQRCLPKVSMISEYMTDVWHVSDLNSEHHRVWPYHLCLSRYQVNALSWASEEIDFSALAKARQDKDVRNAYGMPSISGLKLQDISFGQILPQMSVRIHAQCIDCQSS